MANWVLVIRLVQWLGWKTDKQNKERKTNKQTMMTILTPPLTTQPWYAAIPDLLCIPLCLFALKIWRQCINRSPESGACAHMWSRSQSFALLAGSLQSQRLYPPKSLISPPVQKPIRQTRRGGTPFGGWGCALYKAGVSPGMRASPSTCRVLIIDWHVRGLYRCLWYARGLCLCPCVITPRGFTSLPTGGGV